MEVKYLNNIKKKRNYSNGLFFRIGNNFPFDSKYYQFGFFGHIITLFI